MITVIPKVIRGKVRTVDAKTGRVAKTALGNPIDGGGWKRKENGVAIGKRQCRYVNKA